MSETKKPKETLDIEYHGLKVNYDPSILYSYGFQKASATEDPKKLMYYFEKLFLGKDEELADKLTEIDAPDNGQGSVGAMALLIAEIAEKHKLGNA